MRYSLLIILTACLLLLVVNAAKAAEKFHAPIPSTEFENMAYFPLYPTYSWEPLANTEFYQVQVIQQIGTKEELVRDLANTEALKCVTDNEPFINAGNYYWQVRVVDSNRKPLSPWSNKSFFKVTAPVTFAAFGDSITHGGAAFIPAGQLACQWETFCEVPVKNLGRSGDTTSMMLARFDRDVLPFRPTVLLILGGINDIREGATASEVIKNLSAIREKCLANNIVPVFVAITSVNPKIIKAYLTDGDWQSERDKLNYWINSNPYSLDFNANLNDEQGYLKVEYTPDGLHPNLKGKKIMGEIINNYLKSTFPNLFREQERVNSK